MRRNRDLSLLVTGQFFSALGDHFYLVAMPWLALQVSGSAFVAGTLLACASLPRSAFMLLGGTAADRRSPKSMLILSNGLQAILMALLALAVRFSFVELWFLYGVAFLAGTMDAFGLPAFNSVLPNIVEPDELESGNILLQGANMASGALGPALAGILIYEASVGAPSVRSSLPGLSSAFMVNAVAFLVGILLFWKIRFRSITLAETAQELSALQSLRTVADYIRNDRQLRTILGITFLIGLILTGSIRIGFPLLAESSVDGGIRVFGYMSSAFGVGLLAGMAALRVHPRIRNRMSGLQLLSLFALVPSGLVLLGIGLPVPWMLAVIFMMGAAFGLVLIYMLSWVQRRAPRSMLGRIMAVVLFATIGMAPVSQALMGLLFEVSLGWTLIAAGSVGLVVLLLLGLSPEMRDLQTRTEVHEQDVSATANVP